MPLTPKAVLFDLDNTLWHRDVAVKHVAAAQYAAFPQLSSLSADTYIERLTTLDDRGRADKRLLYQQIVNELGLPIDLVTVLHDHFWVTYQTFTAPAPDAVPVLTALRANGIKTGIVSNGTVTVQDPKIAGLGLAPLMDVIVVSEREGVRKPEKEIFHRALARLGVQPNEAWFVGDHPDYDIRGAAEAGLTAVWMRSWADAAPHATHAISSLSELWRLVMPRVTIG